MMIKGIKYIETIDFRADLIVHYDSAQSISLCRFELFCRFGFQSYFKLRNVMIRGYRTCQICPTLLLIVTKLHRRGMGPWYESFGEKAAVTR